jgi:HlyD family secretion protein
VLSGSEQAVPGVDRRSRPAEAWQRPIWVWTDTVKRGPLLRQVRGPGTLVPREDKIRLIPAETEATVVRIRVLPGAKVEPDTMLMDLVDPTLSRSCWTRNCVEGAEADYINTRAKLQSDLMTRKPARRP